MKTKIYSDTIESFIAEATSPVYICRITRMVGNRIPMREFYIIATAFNREGRPVEYRVFAGRAFAYDDAACRNAADRARALAETIEAKLREKDLDIRHGAISEEPILGEPPD